MRWFDHSINTFRCVLSSVASATPKREAIVMGRETVERDDNNLIAQCFVPFAMIEERRVAAGEDAFTPAFRAPRVVIVFIAKSKNEFQHPRGLCFAISLRLGFGRKGRGAGNNEIVW